MWTQHFYMSVLFTLGDPTLSCRVSSIYTQRPNTFISVPFILHSVLEHAYCIHSQIATRMHSHDNQRDIGLFTHCGKTCMMAASGCTRQRNVSLNTHQNSAHAYITEMVCACAAVSIRRAIWSDEDPGTALLPGWLPLSCEWTLELLLNDKSNKPGVYNSSHPRSVCRLCAKSGGYPGCMLTPVQLM